MPPRVGPGTPSPLRFLRDNGSSMTAATAGVRDLTATDRVALASWIGTRIAVAVLSLGTLWTVIGGPSGNVRSWLSGWDRWDTGLFVKVARFGYQGYPRHYP